MSPAGMSPMARMSIQGWKVMSDLLGEQLHGGLAGEEVLDGEGHAAAPFIQSVSLSSKTARGTNTHSLCQPPLSCV